MKSRLAHRVSALLIGGLAASAIAAGTAVASPVALQPVATTAPGGSATGSGSGSAALVPPVVDQFICAMTGSGLAYACRTGDSAVG
ncbi:hypothetical protein [Nocardia tengchongensis]|uniref:hypothetical protein n=1 Tax=Nocardia tengchongensis TaxID=2055889 RepID=UPI0036B1A54F